MGFRVKNMYASDSNKNVYCKEVTGMGPPTPIPPQDNENFAGRDIILYVTNGGPDANKERPEYIEIENPDIRWENLNNYPQLTRCYVFAGEFRSNNEVLIQMSNIKVGGASSSGSPTTVNVHVGGN